MNDLVMNTQELIPVSYLSLDVSEPIDGWERTLADRGVEIVLDDLGRPSVHREVLGELIAERREHEARLVEDQRRRRSERTDTKVPGVPALEGASAFESMVAGDGDYVSPTREFGRPPPNFLVEELGGKQ